MQVRPTGLVRWVLRQVPQLPDGAQPWSLEGVQFDKVGLAPQAAGDVRALEPQWVLEMCVIEVDARGQPVSTAWVPVPWMTAAEADAEDRAAGINGAGLVVVGRR